MSLEAADSARRAQRRLTRRREGAKKAVLSKPSLLAWRRNTSLKTRTQIQDENHDSSLRVFLRVFASSRETFPPRVCSKRSSKFYDNCFKRQLPTPPSDPSLTPNRPPSLRAKEAAARRPDAWHLPRWPRRRRSLSSTSRGTWRRRPGGRDHPWSRREWGTWRYRSWR